MKTSFRLKLLGVVLLAAGLLSAFADQLTRVRLTVDEDPIVVRLAESLGYFKAEGLDVVRTDLLKVSPEDYLMQAPLIKGDIDASYHWFNHAVFGARHNLPIKAVMVFNDAPGMAVLVANRVKDEVRGAADFKGRRVAEGAGYGTKSVLMHYLARKAGLSGDSYTPVLLEHEGREEAVLKGLRAGQVDIMAFQEPLVSALQATGLVSTLYDLHSRESTAQVLGAPWPAQSLLMAPAFLAAHPDTVQKLVNAFVRTMRFINAHSVDEIIARLPADYFAGKDRATEIDTIKRTLPTLAKGDYTFPAASVDLVVDTVMSFAFDRSEEGKWRGTGENRRIVSADLYTNEFVARAMKEIPTQATASVEPANAGVSIWTQNVTGFRKEHGAEGGYTKRWDLGDLPHYVPKVHLTGTLRVWGNNYIKDGYLAEYWETEFKKFQPDVTIEYHLPTTGIGIPALSCGVADVAMSRRAIIMDLLTFEQVYHHPVTEVEAVTGSYDVYGWSPPFIIVVHKDNPLDRISLKQLDGVFGGARTGGYVGSVWHTEYPFARGPEENIRTWGQLGLTGAWANQPIHIGGQTLRGNQTSQFSDLILKGSDQFAEGYQAFANYITPDGKINSWSLQAQRAIAKDPLAMFYVSPMTLSPDMKELAVQAYDGGPYVKRTLETVHDRTFPLYGRYFFYFNREPGKPVDPKVDEWLRFILSQEGQECVQREGRYIPLTGEVVKAQLKKLD